MAVFVQKELEEVGILAEIDNVPASSLSQMKAQGKALFFRGSWIADYADPENYLSVFYSKNWPPGGPNYFHFANAEYDRIYQQSLTEADENKRFALYRKLEDILMDESPVIVLFYDEIIRLANNRVVGLNTNAINLIDLSKVRLKDF
jgi:peptide/nickel transport system substrate-binding protein